MYLWLGKTPISPEASGDNAPIIEGGLAPSFSILEVRKQLLAGHLFNVAVSLV